MVEVIQPVDDVTIYQGHVLDGLRLIADKSVQCVVTSDPYWGLRDYGMAPVEWPEVAYSPMAGVPPITVPAWTGHYGLEPTPEMYVGHSVLIRRELWRVMRDDGVQWLNLGDSYNGSGGAGGDYGPGGLKEGQPKYPGRRVDGLKAKDLCGIPWRVAFALQADGWYLRSDVIWHKPNPMPESVTDRPTKAHEYIFLLSKSPHYFYDADAIREAWTSGREDMREKGVRTGTAYLKHNIVNHGEKAEKGAGQRTAGDSPAGRNKRTVWTITTTPFPEAHFATFPEALPEACILAGTSPQACPHCGAPWERVTEKERSFESGSGRSGRDPEGKHGAGLQGGGETRDIRRGPTLHVTTTGWQPTCACEDNDGSGKCIALDLFHGSGTSMRVALKHNRAYIGCELNPEYVQMSIRTRLRNLQRVLFA